MIHTFLLPLMTSHDPYRCPNVQVIFNIMFVFFVAVMITIWFVSDSAAGSGGEMSPIPVYIVTTAIVFIIGTAAVHALVTIYITCKGGSRLKEGMRKVCDEAEVMHPGIAFTVTFIYHASVFQIPQRLH